MSAEQANSRKARQYEEMARETRQRAEEAESEALADYFRELAASYERKARHTQDRANRRKHLRDHPEIREQRVAADVDIRRLQREARNDR